MINHPGDIYHIGKDGLIEIVLKHSQVLLKTAFNKI